MMHSLTQIMLWLFSCFFLLLVSQIPSVSVFLQTFPNIVCKYVLTVWICCRKPLDKSSNNNWPRYEYKVMVRSLSPFRNAGILKQCLWRIYILLCLSRTHLFEWLLYFESVHHCGFKDFFFFSLTDLTNFCTLRLIYTASLPRDRVSDLKDFFTTTNTLLITKSP